MSLERRLREGLDVAAAGPAPDVDHQLRIVMTRHRRRARARRSVSVLAAVSVVVAVAVGVPALVTELRPDPPGVLGSTVEPSLAGTYAVVVAASPAADAAGMTGRWTVVLDPSGEVVMTAPERFRGTTSGSTYRVDGELLRVDALIGSCQEVPGAEPVSTYRWTRSATGLVFTATSESCAARQLLFTGQPWEELS